MFKYEFYIDAYYNENEYLEIDVYEIVLFEYEGKKIKLQSLNENKKISESEGVRLTCGHFSDIHECIQFAKIVYTNFLIRLNDTDISYIFDKKARGNFMEYCKEDDSNIYKDIVIVDTENKQIRFNANLEVNRCGCTHFKFSELMNVWMDQKLKDSLMINNYRKYLINKRIDSKIDNTLFISSMEVLIEKEERNKAELDVINEVCEFLDKKYEKTKNNNYIQIKTMIQNNRHKSINSKLCELVEQNSNEDEKNDNLKRVKIIAKNKIVIKD